MRADKGLIIPSSHFNSRLSTLTLTMRISDILEGLENVVTTFIVEDKNLVSSSMEILCINSEEYIWFNINFYFLVAREDFATRMTTALLGGSALERDARIRGINSLLYERLLLVIYKQSVRGKLL